jgi:hypothetical protein
MVYFVRLINFFLVFSSLLSVLITVLILTLHFVSLFADKFERTLEPVLEDRIEELRHRLRIELAVYEGAKNVIRSFQNAKSADKKTLHEVSEDELRYERADTSSRFGYYCIYNKREYSMYGVCSYDVKSGLEPDLCRSKRVTVRSVRSHQLLDIHYIENENDGHLMTFVFFLFGISVFMMIIHFRLPTVFALNNK